MKEEIIYFEINNWFAEQDYPNEEPFLTWMNDKTINNYLNNKDWVKKNKICIKTFIIDMSRSFMITAPISFVEKICPTLLTNSNNIKFISYPTKEKDIPCSRYVGEEEYFLSYTKENIGIIQEGEDY